MIVGDKSIKPTSKLIFLLNDIMADWATYRILMFSSPNYLVGCVIQKRILCDYSNEVKRGVKSLSGKIGWDDRRVQILLLRVPKMYPIGPPSSAFTYYVISSILWKKKLICLPPVSFGLAHRKVTDLLSKSTILGSPGALGGPEKWKEVVFLKFLRQIK